jgi:hypothetical protein
MIRSFLAELKAAPQRMKMLHYSMRTVGPRELAEISLKSDPRDSHGLLALTIADGMESDDDALVERKRIAAIRLTHQAELDAEATLAADPSAQDAYGALGMSNYVIASLRAFKRALLWMGARTATAPAEWISCGTRPNTAVISGRSQKSFWHSPTNVSTSRIMPVNSRNLWPNFLATLCFSASSRCSIINLFGDG